MANNSQKLCKWIYLFSFIAALAVSSCSYDPVKTNYYDRDIRAHRGEEITIKWGFSHTDHVRISGIDNRYFEPEDSVTLMADESCTVFITAYQGDVDSVTVETNIILFPSDDDEVQRGPVSFGEARLPQSYTESEYLIGHSESTAGKHPKTIKIMKTKVSENHNKFTAHVAALDEYGNFINGLTEHDFQENWKFFSSCDDYSIAFSPSSSKEPAEKSESLDLGIMFDVSSAANYNYFLRDQLSEFLTTLSEYDNVLLTSFNQVLSGQPELLSAEETLINFYDFKMPPPKGLNGLYKNGYHVMNKLSKGPNNKKALIIVTYYSDNASLVYTANDMAKLAAENDIPVYVIGVGSALMSYSLRYLTDVTGGRFYMISEEELPFMSSILTEIAYAQKYYYEMTCPLPTVKEECQKYSVRLDYRHDNITTDDKKNVYPNIIQQYIPYQAAALFEFKSTDIQESYVRNLTELAVVLKNNPESAIELIGHSGNEGGNNHNYELSLQRADRVKAVLTEMGVNSSQIVTRGLGSTKPLYYFEMDEWQSLYNRRVEIRWLDPSVLPYEILAGETNTENDAAENVGKWEERGMQAYFDRYYIDDNTVYKIKIWGFATEQEAQETAKKLKKKYKKEFAVE